MGGTAAGAGCDGSRLALTLPGSESLQVLRQSSSADSLA